MPAPIIRPFRRRLQTTRNAPMGRLSLDPVHPLARGLISCYVPGAMGGIDLCGNVQLAFVSGPTIGLSSEGPGLRTTGTMGLAGTAAPIHKTGNTYTVYYRGLATGSSTAGQLFGISYDNAGGSPFTVVCLTSGTGSWVSASPGYAWNNAGSFNEIDDIPVFTTNTTVSYGATFSAPANEVRSYNNGLLVSNNAMGAGDPTSTATSQVVFYVATAQEISINAVATVGYIWNRVLSAEEMSLLHTEPYSFLVGDEYEMPSIFLSVADVLMAQVCM